MTRNAKITPTREDVLKVFADGVGGPNKWGLTRPIGTNDIAREIAEARGGDWEDPYALISKTALIALLEEMLFDRTLTMCLGREWAEEGVMFHDQRPNLRYWTTRERAEQWRQKREKEKQAAEEKKAAQEADRYARELLVIRHSDEYEELIEAYHNGARLVDQER